MTWRIAPTVLAAVVLETVVVLAAVILTAALAVGCTGNEPLHGECRPDVVEPRDDLLGGFTHTMELEDGTARTSELWVTWDGRYLVGADPERGLETLFRTDDERRGAYDEEGCFVPNEAGAAHLHVDWGIELAGVAVADLLGVEAVDPVNVFLTRAERPEVERDAAGAKVRHSFTTAYQVEAEQVLVRHTLTRR